MSRRFSSHSLLRAISDEAREIRVLTKLHRPSQVSATRTESQALLQFPDVQSPVQYLIDMGLKPTLARHISSIYMEFIARHKQVFRSYFRRITRGGCHLQPEYYRDMFIIQFRVTTQVWGSQLMSTVWAWLCRAGLPPAVSHPKCMSTRVDKATKAEILLRLGLEPTSLVTGSDHSENMNSRSKKDYWAEREAFIKPRAVLPAPSPLTETTTATCDVFRRDAPSNCFPTIYPPSLSETPQRTLITAFAPTSSIRNDEERLAKRCANMSSLSSLLSRMTVTVPDVCPESRGNCKDGRIPDCKRTPSLSPLLASKILNISGPSNGHQPMTGSASSTKPTITPRIRRIAALPKRHTEAPTSLSTLHALPCCSSLAMVYPLNSTSHILAESATKSVVTKNTHLDCVVAPSRTIDVQLTSPVQNPAVTSGPLTLKSVVSKQRKKTISRRAHSQSQPVPSPPPRQASTSPTLPVWRASASSRTLSRTPSLVSDTSSAIDSSTSSSDELDTPPSTPSPSSLALPTHDNDIATLLDSPAMSTPGKQSLGSAKVPRCREEIDFTKRHLGNDSEERTFTFTFGSLF